MNPSSARLLLLNGAAGYRRLAGLVAGVAVGVAMLLILLGAYLHMPDRDDRIAWRSYGGEAISGASSATQVPTPTDGTALRDAFTDYFMGGTYTVVKVAATDNSAVKMPNGLALPGPGKYYASPAMAALIAAHPMDQLGARFGTPLGTLDPALLQGPSDLVVLVGADWNSLARTSETVLVTSFPSSGTKLTSGVYRVVLAVGSVAVLVPIVLLISIVSQLGAAERRERFATVRLIGAGRRAIAVISGLEMLLATFAGAVLGIGVAAALRPLAGRLALNGSTSYGSDLTPSAVWTVVGVVGVVVLGGVTAWWRTYRDDVGALGATRERAEKRVTAWRTATLVVGLAMLVGPAIAIHANGAQGGVLAFVMIGGFAVTAFGIVVAGPWLTRLASGFLGRFARRAPTLVASGRLSRHARATFRSVAGLVVAVFIVSLFAGVVSAIAKITTPQETPGTLSMATVMTSVGSAEEAAAVSAALEGVDGVKGVAVAYAAPDQDWHDVMSAADARAIGAIDVPNAPAVKVDSYGMLSGAVGVGSDAFPAPVATDAIQGLVPSKVFAITDGTPAAKERARTAIEIASEPGLGPVTRADYASAGSRRFTQEMGALAYLGMAVAIGIAALSLTVATVAAALDRKRTFALLRLGGMPSGDLRRVIAVEAGVPLAATLAISAGLGFFVAWLMVTTLGNGQTMGWPDARYWWAIVASVAIGAAAVMGSFSVVRRSTEVTSTRFE